jgi:hypothetical protein
LENIGLVVLFGPYLHRRFACPVDEQDERDKLIVDRCHALLADRAG